MTAESREDKARQAQTPRTNDYIGLITSAGPEHYGMLDTQNPWPDYKRVVDFARQLERELARSSSAHIESDIGILIRDLRAEAGYLGQHHETAKAALHMAQAADMLEGFALPEYTPMPHVASKSDNAPDMPNTASARSARPATRSAAALPADIRRTLEESNLPIEVATAIADLCERSASTPAEPKYHVRNGWPEPAACLVYQPGQLSDLCTACGLTRFAHESRGR